MSAALGTVEAPRRSGAMGGRAGERPGRSVTREGLTCGMLSLLLSLLVLVPVQAQAPEAPGDTLTVVTLNIWFDRGDWPARLDGIAAGLAALGADVVFLQEVLQNATLPNQARTIADRVGMPYVHFVSVDPPGGPKRFGNAILSRWPFEATDSLDLPPLDAYRAAAHARIRVGSLPVDLYTAHLQNPPDVAGSGARAMEIAHLLGFVAATRAEGPLVLGGDFNAEPQYPEMRMLGRFRDLGPAAPTWGPAYTHVAGRRIDYLMDEADPRLVLVDSGRALDQPDAAGRYPSDHFAVYARFVLPAAP